MVELQALEMALMLGEVVAVVVVRELVVAGLDAEGHPAASDAAHPVPERVGAMGAAAPDAASRPCNADQPCV